MATWGRRRFGGPHRERGGKKRGAHRRAGLIKQLINLEQLKVEPSPPTVGPPLHHRAHSGPVLQTESSVRGQRNWRAEEMNLSGASIGDCAIVTRRLLPTSSASRSPPSEVSAGDYAVRHRAVGSYLLNESRWAVWPVLAITLSYALMFKRRDSPITERRAVITIQTLNASSQREEHTIQLLLDITLAPWLPSSSEQSPPSCCQLADAVMTETRLPKRPCSGSASDARGFPPAPRSTAPIVLPGGAPCLGIFKPDRRRRRAVAQGISSRLICIPSAGLGPSRLRARRIKWNERRGPRADGGRVSISIP
ncbi:hypothetical protein SKAU_G00202030 [Synaphobranchus kaupii]|uniref:Uncharacterized protein n=1 Tax=Synaphobranchus kaupii TaxID=118154 RepID=A0A9Q1FFP1_SYNKA|nr:hypothetical protein SKAU_G00202030 [Synaphobranchus kaupii]